MKVKRLSKKQRRSEGSAVRASLPRVAHAKWNPPSDRADPWKLLEQSNQGRLEDLSPLRFARMKDSAFAFFRGSAIIMAHDLAQTPTTGILVQSCGDCHLQNFGWFATPERHLAFDVTDFDETAVAPWEWDLKRLAVSFALTASSESQGLHLAQAVCQSYRRGMAEFSRVSAMEVWYACLTVPFLLDHAINRRERIALEKVAKKASSQTIEAWLPKLTTGKGSKRRFRKDTDELLHRKEPEFRCAAVQQVVESYRTTIQEDRRELLSRYRLVDVAFKVVGVGSVGLRCLIALLLDDLDEPLVLQIKEARPSVLAPFLAADNDTHQGHRIVRGQRLMQSASDVFLGWGQGPKGRDFYVRQLRDMKLSVNSLKMPGKQLFDYAELCGWALARAHAKSDKSLEISGYLGPSDKFDRAMATFAVEYTKQVHADFDTFNASLDRA